jgi:hypothetical protein
MNFTRIQRIPDGACSDIKLTDHFYPGSPRLVGREDTSVYFDLAGGTFKCDLEAWVNREANPTIPAREILPPEGHMVAMYVADGDRLLVGPEWSGHLAGGASNLLHYEEAVRMTHGCRASAITLRALPGDGLHALPRGELNDQMGFIPW